MFTGGAARIALVCSSNQNRSMEAHALLVKRGIPVASFGTGQQVRLPSNQENNHNVYPFGTSYATIAEDLARKNRTFYTENGLLSLMERNSKIKPAPQRFQDENSLTKFLLIITYTDRVYEAVLEEFAQRGSTTFEPAYVINIETEDNREEALVAATRTLSLVQTLEANEDWQENLDTTLKEFEKKHGLTNGQLIYSIVFH